MYSVLRGQEICDRLREKYYTDSAMFLVFLFSDDWEINKYTLYYLQYLRYQKKISGFLIVSPYREYQPLCEANATYPYQFVVCDKEEMRYVSRYYVEVARFVDKNMIINGSHDVLEKRYLELVRDEGISKKEIVAFGVFHFQKLPTESEMEDAKNYNQIHQYKKINWASLYDDTPDEKTGEVEFPLYLDVELRKLVENRAISKEDKIVLFSATKTTRYILSWLKGYNVVAILDNDEKLSGSDVDGVVVHTPQEFLKDVQEDAYRIIVPTKSYKLICEQLYYMGYEFGRQVFVIYKDYGQALRKRMAKCLYDFEEGKQLYRSIREQYPDRRIYVCPYPGTGDMYLVGMYLKDRMKYDGVSECIVVVSAESSKRIFSLFGYEFVNDIVVIEGREQANQLIMYATEVGYEETNVAVLNLDYGLIELPYLGGYKGLDFNTLYQRVIFFAKNRRTCIDLRKESADELFEKHQLRKGHTVLLSPYSSDTTAIDEDVWNILARVLKDKGYDICTNIVGDEQPVQGTTGIFIPYAQIIDFMEKAGAFVGFRSGLCDIISGANALKVILYPKDSLYMNSTFYEYFSLEHMGLVTEDLFEFIIEKENKAQIIDEIMELF